MLDARIKNIQKTVGATADGSFGRLTAIAILNYIGATPQGNTLQEYIRLIQKSIGLTGKSADGILGPQTMTKLEDFISSKLAPLSEGTNMIISSTTLNKIIEFNVV